MKTSHLFTGMIILSLTLYAIPQNNEVPQQLRDYKRIVYNCTLKVLNTPSDDVKRLDKNDDPAIGKVMDGEIFECVDKQMELFYEQRT